MNLVTKYTNMLKRLENLRGNLHPDAYAKALRKIQLLRLQEYRRQATEILNKPHLSNNKRTRAIKLLRKINHKISGVKCT